MEFNEDSLKWQDFKGVAVVNTDIKKVKSNFTVLLTNGIGFQVADTADTLQLDLMLPASTYTDTSGLLGDIDGTKTLPDGTTFIINVNDRNDLYNNFELAWAVNETDDLFSDILLANNTFQGEVNLYPTEMPGHIPGSSRFCSISLGKVLDECVFDYKFTGSPNLARATRDAAVRYAALRTNLQPVRSCGLLNVPRSKKSNYGYTIGTTTTITECRTGSLSGTRSYTCVETSNVTQEWSPAVTATCDAVKTKSTDIGMIVGVVVVVAVVVLIALIIAILAVKKRRKQKRKSFNEQDTAEERVAMKTAE